MENSYQKGISVIEILIIIVIMTTLTVVILPEFAKFRNAQILQNTVLDIVSTSNKAKSDTMASLDSSLYGVHFDNYSVTLFKGDTYIENDPDNQITLFNTKANISSIDLDNSGNDIYFSRIYGKPNTYGLIEVSVGSLVKNITINQSGGISTN